MENSDDIEGSIQFQSTANSQLPSSIPPLPPPSSLGKKKPVRAASEVWEHFTKIENSDPRNPRCKCNYCGRDYACDTKRCGTTTLKNHLNQCKKYFGRLEDKKQKILTFQGHESGGSNLVAVGFTKEEGRRACAKMIIMDELPFSFVENRGFRHFCSVCCPKFDPPSRRTIVRDIYQLYLDEKLKLRNIFIQGQRVSLTTDCWTSIQNVNYLSLTAHYIDSDWMLHKRMLNFCMISNHKGETIGKVIHSCLHEWGIMSVCTITVDNASANDTAVFYLKRKLNDWDNGCVFSGTHLHMRCCAHIVNLIVNEGLKEAHESIVSIRNAVKFVRASPSRMQRFKECASEEKIDCNSLLVLDVPTRWNSTYLMLEAALKFQKVFMRFEEDDIQYLHYFQENDGGKKRVGPPSTFDWQNALVFVNFLKSFYDVTLKFSSSLHVSSNIYLHEVCSIQTQLDEWSLSGDYLLSEMATKMKRKFEKYWGSMDNVNQMLLVACVLDPRYKMDYVEICLGEIYSNDEVASEMIKSVKNNLMDIYDWYVRCEAKFGIHEASGDGTSSMTLKSTQESSSSTSSIFSARIDKLKQKQRVKNIIEIKNDVERYLLDASEDIEAKDFNILNWWRVNGKKYGVLSIIARDVFAIQVSTVASESAFSTGGRILDPFRSSLSTRMVEALVCAQNWLQSSSNTDRFFVEDVEYYEKLDADILESTSIEHS